MMGLSTARGCVVGQDGAVVHVRLSGELAGVVRSRAARESRSASNMAVALIREALELRRLGPVVRTDADSAGLDRARRGVVTGVSRAEVEAAAELGPAFDGVVVREPPVVPGDHGAAFEATERQEAFLREGRREVTPDPRVKP